jgi:hypothetical protein
MKLILFYDVAAIFQPYLLFLPAQKMNHLRVRIRIRQERRTHSGGCRPPPMLMLSGVASTVMIARKIVISY